MVAYVAARVPFGETIVGDKLREHPAARVVFVLAGRRERMGRTLMDLAARFQGLPDEAVREVLREWPARYGESPVPLGPHAALLSLPLNAQYPPGVGELLRQHGRLGVAGNVAQGPWLEQWLACSDEAGAGFLAAQTRAALAAVPAAEVRVDDPGPLAHEWLGLHAAADTASPMW